MSLTFRGGGIVLRNAPGLANLDLSLTKDSAVSENVTVQFRTGFFNIFNRPNLGLPNAEVFNRSGSRRGNAGFIEDTITTARQIQLALRVIF